MTPFGDTFADYPDSGQAEACRYSSSDISASVCAPVAKGGEPIEARSLCRYHCSRAAPCGPGANGVDAGCVLGSALADSDSLKFDFFFREKGEYRQSISRHPDRTAPHWEKYVRDGADSINELIRGIRPLSAKRFLRSFLESYWVVACCVTLKSELAANDRHAFCQFRTGTALWSRRVTHSLPNCVAFSIASTRFIGWPGMPFGAALAQRFSHD